jgi:hypothetical protein
VCRRFLVVVDLTLAVTEVWCSVGVWVIWSVGRSYTR